MINIFILAERNKKSPEPLEKAKSGGNEVENLMAKIRYLFDFQQQIAFTVFDFYQLMEIEKKWTQPIHNWGLIMKQFILIFENRIQI